MEVTFVHIDQSLPICCSMAAIGGVFEVGATALTAVPAVRSKQGVAMSYGQELLALAGNITLQGIGSILSHLVAPWFGPVSAVVPFFYSATLLTNMLVFGILLKEDFTKNMRVGTYVIVVAVILLPLVGPDVQEDQHVGILMRHWYSIVWFILLILASLSTGVMLALDITKHAMRRRFTILLVARASSLTLNITVSRFFILGPSQTVLIIFLIIKVVSGAVYTYAIVVQSTAVDQARFVPLNATTIILVNALTGVIVWEDWRVMSSWYGYMCVFVLLGLGCDLLLSVPLLNADNPEFGRRTSLMIVRQSVAAKRRMKHRKTNSNTDSVMSHLAGYGSIQPIEEGQLQDGDDSFLTAPSTQHQSLFPTFHLDNHSYSNNSYNNNSYNRHSYSYSPRMDWSSYSHHGSLSNGDHDGKPSISWNGSDEELTDGPPTTHDIEGSLSYELDLPSLDNQVSLERMETPKIKGSSRKKEATVSLEPRAPVPATRIAGGQGNREVLPIPSTPAGAIRMDADTGVESDALTLQRVEVQTEAELEVGAAEREGIDRALPLPTLLSPSTVGTIARTGMSSATGTGSADRQSVISTSGQSLEDFIAMCRDDEDEEEHEHEHEHEHEQEQEQHHRPHPRRGSRVSATTLDDPRNLRHYHAQQRHSADSANSHNSGSLRRLSRLDAWKQTISPKRRIVTRQRSMTK